MASRVLITAAVGTGLLGAATGGSLALFGRVRRDNQARVTAVRAAGPRPGRYRRTQDA